MTGLSLDVDELVEVAVVVTDSQLTPLDAGFQVVIRPSDEALAQMNDLVTEMHTTSGLLEELPGGTSVTAAQESVLAYIRQHIPNAGTAPLAGNTIGTDRAFLAKYMPLVDAHLHYRNVDVSSIKELSRRWFPRVYFHAPAKNGGHRALADIFESIRELAYYRRAVLVADPGPTSEEATAVSAAVVAEWAPRMP